MSELPNKFDDYLLGAKNFYPNLEFGHSSYFKGGNIFDVKWEFKNTQNVLSQTEYLYPEQKKFIHYTSFDTLWNIINENQLRLYNLNKLNDPRELIYPAREFDLHYPPEQMEAFRSSYFLGSMCAYDEQRQPDDFILWRLYGKDGNGVGIVFDLENPEAIWYQSFLGKVIYNPNADCSNTLRQFINFHNAFSKDNLEFQNIPSIILTMLLLHKHESWSMENEFRIITHLSYDRITLKMDGSQSNFNYSEMLYHEMTMGVKQTGYVTLPLSPINDTHKRKIGGNDGNIPLEHLNSIFPMFKISKVILGYKYNDVQRFEIEFLLNKVTASKSNSSKNNDRIVVEITPHVGLFK